MKPVVSSARVAREDAGNTPAPPRHSPFTKMFRDTGGFSADFNEAWNQAERYLDFARTERGYLGRKGLKFDNPQCYLILGSGFSEEEIEQVRTKERVNPAIQLWTYDNLLAYVKWTIDFIRKVSNSP